MGNHLSLWAQSYCQGGLHTAISWLVKSLARAQSNGVSMITLPRWSQRLQCETQCEVHRCGILLPCLTQSNCKVR